MAWLQAAEVQKMKDFGSRVNRESEGRGRTELELQNSEKPPETLSGHMTVVAFRTEC